MPLTDATSLQERIRTYLAHLDRPSYICDQELGSSPPRSFREFRHRLAARGYVSFASVSNSISNFLSVSNTADYTHAMVEDMAGWIEHHPFQPGEDRDAYYRAFGEFHEAGRRLS